MKSESVARSVLGMRRYTQVWDGAQSHRSELVRSTVGVKAVAQPAYSPELNPAEWVFEEVRRVYGCVEEKTAAVDECLSRLESDPEPVKSLVSRKWIMRNVQDLSEDYSASSG